MGRETSAGVTGAPRRTAHTQAFPAPIWHESNGSSGISVSKVPGTILTFHDPVQSLPESRSIEASDHRSAAAFLIDWLEDEAGFASVTAVGHRVVHGMNYTEPQRVTQELMDELHRISPYDPDHLPAEIELIEAFRQHHPKLLQVACFDLSSTVCGAKCLQLIDFMQSGTLQRQILVSRLIT